VVGAPSPFSRLGNGPRATKPDFCAHAGNANANFERQSGLGVWALSAQAQPIEVFGTSHAAPLLAREAAFVFDQLRTKCDPGSQPYACTVKAILALTANAMDGLPSSHTELKKRALGYGVASSFWLRNPNSSSTLLFWQGFAERAGEIIRVRIPIPRAWLREAVEPQLRLCVSWDAPVNAAARSWACRDVSATLCAHEDARGARGSRRKAAGYPLFVRTWDLKNAAEATPPTDDLWVLELSYEQISAYAAAHFPSPLQRIAFAAELRDVATAGVSAQAYLQALPVSSTMNRFSIAAIPLRQPLSVPT
jgi:hypothetical protein